MLGLVVMLGVNSAGNSLYKKFDNRPVDGVKTFQASVLVIE